MNAAPVRTHDDTTDLLEKAAGADAHERIVLEDELVHRYLGLATHLAGRYAGRGADREDLIQVASFALVKAIRGFNHDRGEFVPFATVTILGEIKKFFRDQCWGVRPPRRIQQLQADIAAATERRMQADARTPDDSDLAVELDAEVSDIREAQAARSCFSPSSLDQPTRIGGRPLGETLMSDESDYDFIEEWVSVAPLCQQLSDDERELLRLRFVEDKTQQEIAAIIGVSQMQVSRRLSKLLDSLRSEVLQPSAA
ncbi:SigB/SigF/SigG family RNA polymerase sigma factor [Aeromicrobium panaciterrae]|uniref:sigma-70 family RNA polymerase sigma factor n=1 Tax=Aeromicrobium panaciterrae TaxID=363861 RepID=UPI0031D8C449